MRAVGMHPLQPRHLARVAIATAAGRSACTCRRRSPRRRGPMSSDGGMRLHRDVPDAAERLPIGGDDLDVEQRLAGLADGHVRVGGSHRQQDVEQPVQHGRRCLRRRDQRDPRVCLVVTFAPFRCSLPLAAMASMTPETADMSTDDSLPVPGSFATPSRARSSSHGDPGYDEARAVWNAMIDRRPAVIVRPRDVADVVAAVRFARDHDLPVSVRGGGHNVAGHAVGDDSVMLDLSAMRGVRVDPEPTPGVRRGWRDLERRRSGDPGVRPGDAGRPHLGHGRRRPDAEWRHRLAPEPLRPVHRQPGLRRGRARDGRVVRASADEHADLLWALKGGGGNFGVVTEFEFALHPVGPKVMFCAPDLSDRGRQRPDPVLARLPRRQERRHRVPRRVLDDPGGSRLPGGRLGQARLHDRRAVRRRCRRGRAHSSSRCANWARWSRTSPGRWTTPTCSSSSTR